MPQNTFEHLRTILDNFRTLNFFCFFSWVFSKYLPQILSPENWIQFFSVQKTEFIFLSSGIWTNNFKSRKSEMGLRILTVAWMQRECLLSIVSENWTLKFKSGKLNSYFSVQETWKALHGTLGKKNRKNRPKACSKHVWTLLGSILCTFGILKLFLIFLKIFDDSMEHWAKKIGKIAPKHVQNTFGHFGDQFWALLEFWNFSWFFWKYSMTPWNTGQKKSEKSPQSMFKTRLDTLGTILGTFRILKFFFDFFEKFRWLHGTLGKKNVFKKIAPKHLWTFGNVFEKF